MNALANSQYGELEKFLRHGYPDGRGPVTLRRYTGQESDEQKRGDRRQPAGHPADELRDAGADPDPAPGAQPDRRGAGPAVPGPRRAAHLPRPPGEPTSRCWCGGSATRSRPTGSSASVRRPRWPAPGRCEEQRAQVAGVASDLFGAEVRPEDVIGETLRRATPPCDRDDAGVPRRLADRVADPGRPARPATPSFVADPLSVLDRGDASACGPRPAAVGWSAPGPGASPGRTGRPPSWRS